MGQEVVPAAWESWSTEVPIGTTSFSWVGGVFKEEVGQARAGEGCRLVKEVVLGISKPVNA